MIQRIQSLWLFLASLPCFLFFFFPIADFSSETTFFSFNANGLSGADAILDQLGNVYPSFFAWLLMVLIVATLVVPFITIFRFKNRKKQILLTRLSILLNIILLIAIFLLTDMLTNRTGAAYHFNYLTTCSPIVSMIFLLLASRGIQKDEKLVKAADRIR
ncbi:MAG: DUF4293 domain-containing protein [Bacteroidales bacterium]|nr:DUF4293 domain-containing protein [Bacteroidales bacterium]